MYKLITRQPSPSFDGPYYLRIGGYDRRQHAPRPAAPAASGSLSMAAAIVCVVLVALDLRPGIVSTGPLLPSIIREFGLSHTQAALLTAIPTLLMGLLAAPVPWLSRRYGRDRVMFAALALLTVSSLVRALADSVTWLFATTVGIGAGIAIAGVLIASFVKAGFPRQVAIFMSLYATALALGSTLSAAATGTIAAWTGGWRLASGVWALPGVLALLAWLFVVKRGAAPVAAGAAAQRYGMPFRNRTAWLIALFFACNNFVFYACISWLAPMYVEAGWTPAHAGLLLATFTLAFMAANPVFGFLSRDEDRRLPLALGAGTALAGMLAIVLAPTVSPYVAVAVLAFGTGGSFTLSMTLPLDNTKHAEETGAWNSFVLLVSYTIAAAGPLALGQLRDSTGAFRSALWLLVAVSIVMLAVTPFLQPHRRKNAGADARSSAQPNSKTCPATFTVRRFPD
jgi:CP family cyanate transporter-like MFS transporter